MSRFAVYETTLRDPQHIVAALGAMGYEHVECYPEPQALYGYVGDKRSEQAEVIIRRQYVGSASNDIGFAKNPDGTYRAIISEYDRGRHGDTWLGKLKQEYSISKTMAAGRRRGLVFSGRETIGTEVKLHFLER